MITAISNIYKVHNSLFFSGNGMQNASVRLDQFQEVPFERFMYLETCYAHLYQIDRLMAVFVQPSFGEAKNISPKLSGNIYFSFIRYFDDCRVRG